MTKKENEKCPANYYVNHMQNIDWSDTVYADCLDCSKTRDFCEKSFIFGSLEEITIKLGSDKASV